MTSLVTFRSAVFFSVSTPVTRQMTGDPRIVTESPICCHADGLAQADSIHDSNRSSDRSRSNRRVCHVKVSRGSQSRAHQ
jgi:hypothetical protein